MTTDDPHARPSVLYLDTSALAKLVRDEVESAALRGYIDGLELVTSSVALTELPRAMRRAVGATALPLDLLLTRSKEVLDAVALVPVDYALLEIAGALSDPSLRSLDAIHIASAASVSLSDPFVSYDKRQLEAAGEVGLITATPR